MNWICIRIYWWISIDAYRRNLIFLYFNSLSHRNDLWCITGWIITTCCDIWDNCFHFLFLFSYENFYLWRRNRWWLDYRKRTWWYNWLRSDYLRSNCNNVCTWCLSKRWLWCCLCFETLWSWNGCVCWIVWSWGSNLTLNWWIIWWKRCVYWREWCWSSNWTLNWWTMWWKRWVYRRVWCWSSKRCCSGWTRWCKRCFYRNCCWSS